MIAILFFHRCIILGFFIEAIALGIKPSLVGLDVRDDINVCPVDILESTSVGICSDTHCLVDTSDFNSVTWLHIVDQVFISTYMDCLWCFTFWNTLRSLLYLNVLLIREDALVVDNLERVALVAVLTEGWLLDAASLYASFLFSLTFHALEVSFFHLRYNITVANDNSSESDKFINMVGVQLSDPVDLPEVVWSDLNDGILVLLLVELHFLVSLIASRHNFHSNIFVTLRDYKIEDWNNI